MNEPNQGGNAGGGVPGQAAAQGPAAGTTPGHNPPVSIGPGQFEVLRDRFKRKLATDGDTYLVLMLIARGWNRHQVEEFLALPAHRVATIIDGWPSLQNNL